ncbi:hypothetical protein GGR92_000417 [Spirosoma lacussanchae]
MPCGMFFFALSVRKAIFAVSTTISHVEVEAARHPLPADLSNTVYSLIA